MYENFIVYFNGGKFIVKSPDTQLWNWFLVIRKIYSFLKHVDCHVPSLL